jgi:hypothetical protein
MAINNGMYIITSWAIKEGKLQDFKDVLEKMIETIRDLDPGAAFIDYYLSDDEKTSFGVEYYDTPDSYVLAAELVKKWVPELDAASSAKEVWVLGEITPAVRKVLEGWDYVHGKFMMGYFNDGGLPWARLLEQAKNRAGNRRGGVG